MFGVRNFTGLSFVGKIQNFTLTFTVGFVEEVTNNFTMTDRVANNTF